MACDHAMAVVYGPDGAQGSCGRCGFRVSVRAVDRGEQTALLVDAARADGEDLTPADLAVTEDIEVQFADWLGLEVASRQPGDEADYAALGGALGQLQPLRPGKKSRRREGRRAARRRG